MLKVFSAHPFSCSIIFAAMDKFDLKGEYTALHSKFPVCAECPVVGITANYRDGNAMLAEAYYASVLAAGGVPFIIPPYAGREALVETLRHVDAVILSGGADIDPRYMGEEPIPQLGSVNSRRDEQELMLTLMAVDRGIPILGICRGIQTLAVALGGAVHQDIYTSLGNNLLKHDQEPIERAVATHSVNLVPGSRLAALFGKECIDVNTFHHQAVSMPPKGFEVTGTSPDGVIEAIEAVCGRPIIGVQWHPESFVMNNDTCMMPLFGWLVSEAVLYRRAKEIHSSIITLDSHCDTPMLFEQGYKFEERSSVALVDLHKMNDGGLEAVTMVAYIPQGERDTASLSAATAKADKLLQGIVHCVDCNSDSVVLCSTVQELRQAKKDRKKAVMCGIENGYAIGRDISNIERYRSMGVVYITLCHNGDNDICDSARGMAEHGGLSDFGVEVVKEMNRVGMVVDLSHAAESTFWQVLEQSTVPVVCSHSSCKSLCNHPRNLTDDQMKALAANGGVVQVTMYEGFLRESGRATIDDFISHLEHAIEVAGIDHVGIGTDFDGDGAVVGCSSAAQLHSVTVELLRRGYSESDIEKIWGGNWLRVIGVVQSSARNL